MGIFYTQTHFFHLSLLMMSLRSQESAHILSLSHSFRLSKWTLMLMFYFFSIGFTEPPANVSTLPEGKSPVRAGRAESVDLAAELDALNKELAKKPVPKPKP